VVTELNRDEYGVIRHYPEDGMLELEWLEASANMTDDDFKRSMQRFSELAGEHGTPCLIVDVTTFKTRWARTSAPGATSTSSPRTTPLE